MTKKLLPFEESKENKDHEDYKDDKIPDEFAKDPKTLRFIKTMRELQELRKRKLDHTDYTAEIGIFLLKAGLVIFMLVCFWKFRIMGDFSGDSLTRFLFFSISSYLIFKYGKRRR